MTDPGRARFHGRARPVPWTSVDIPWKVRHD